MKTAAKVWLIIAAALVVAGSVLFVVVMAPGHWDFKGLGEAYFVTTTIDVDADFREILVESDTESVLIQPSPTGSAWVRFLEHDKVIPSARVTDGRLVITTDDTRKWYERITFSGSGTILVYLPQTGYDRLTVKNSTGSLLIPRDFTFGSIDAELATGSITCNASASGTVRLTTSTGRIMVEKVNAGEMELTASTGRITVNAVRCGGTLTVNETTGSAAVRDVVCADFRSKGSTGTIMLEKVIASGTFSVKRSTGSVRLEKCDAAEIEIETNTGSVKGSLLSGKVFTARSDTGRVRVPESDASGGSCRVTTNTGSISITVAGE